MCVVGLDCATGRMSLCSVWVNEGLGYLLWSARYLERKPRYDMKIDLYALLLCNAYGASSWSKRAGVSCGNE